PSWKRTAASRLTPALLMLIATCVLQAAIWVSPKRPSNMLTKQFGSAPAIHFYTSFIYKRGSRYSSCIRTIRRSNGFVWQSRAHHNGQLHGRCLRQRLRRPDMTRKPARRSSATYHSAQPEPERLLSGRTRCPPTTRCSWLTPSGSQRACARPVYRSDHRRRRVRSISLPIRGKDER